MRADAFVGFSSGHTQARLVRLFGTPFAVFVVLILVYIAGLWFGSVLIC